MALVVQIKVGREVLGEMHLVNDGTGTEEIGNYDVVLIDKRMGDRFRFMFHVDGFNRTHSTWDLIKRVLDAYAKVSTGLAEASTLKQERVL